MPANKNPTGRRWCFTINNPENILLPQDLEKDKDYRCSVFQLETGESGTVHYQGYVEFKASVRRNRVKKLLEIAGTAHLEQANGSPYENLQYCTKEEARLMEDETFGAWGDWESGGQGKRNDVKRLVELIKTGAKDSDIVEELPAMLLRYGRGIDRIRLALSGKREEKSEVVFCYGKSNFGKSFWAKNNYPNAFWKPANNDWFDTYVGEQTVILDDFTGKWFNLDFFLRLCDRYPLLCPIKGGFVNVNPKTIVITSQYLPSEWYRKVTDGNPDRLKAITRRIDKYLFFLREHEDPLEFHSWDEFHGAYYASMGLVPSPINPNFIRSRVPSNNNEDN